jgi:hypothetical protein
MSVHAGTIIHVAGNNVIDRLQSAGLGDVNVPIDTIREVGNYEVVDKVPQEPDFQFSLESWDVSTEMEAMLTGKVGSATPGASGAYPGAADPDGTEYKWSDCGMLNIISPWKDATTGTPGVIGAGHIVPGYYPTRIAYNYGVTDNASGDGRARGRLVLLREDRPGRGVRDRRRRDNTFDTAEVPRQYRKGGSGGHGVPLRLRRHRRRRPPDGGRGLLRSRTRAAARRRSPSSTRRPTTRSSASPTSRRRRRRTRSRSTPRRSRSPAPSVAATSRSASTSTRGSASVKVGGVQTVTLEATVDSTVEREFDNEDIVRPHDQRPRRERHPRGPLEGLQGVHPAHEPGDRRRRGRGLRVAEPPHVGLEIAIQNPKNTGQILKTLWVDDAQFQPARHGRAREHADRLHLPVGVEVRRLLGLQGRPPLP